MKKCLILFGNSMKRNWICLAISILFGATLCLLLGYFGAETKNDLEGLSVGIVDADQSALSRDLRSYLEKEQGMNLVENTSYEFLSRELIERHVSAILEIPSGFQEKALAGKPDSLTMTTLDDYENSAFLQVYLDSYLSGAHLLAAGAQGDPAVLESLLQELSAASIPMEQEYALPYSVEQISQRESFVNCIGFFLMFSFLFAILLSSIVFQDRTKGLYQRIQITSVNPIQYVCGNGLFGFVNFAAFLLVFLGYIQISGIQVGVPLPVILLFSLLHCFFVFGVALVSALYLPSKNAIMAALIGGSTITCLLGGAYFPLDIVPEVLQKAARFTPQYWFMDAIRGVQSAGDYAWGRNAAILGLFTLLAFLAAGIRFAKSQKAAHV